MQLSKKTQGTIIAMIVVLIASITMMGCITNPSKPSNSGPLELTDNGVASALNKSSFFIIEFYYPGCGPCKYMNNTTSELSNELQGQIGFGRMNVREKGTRQTVDKYKVSAYPTLLFFDEGVLVNRMKGDMSKSDLLAEIKDLKPGLDVSKVNLQSSVAHVQACVNVTKSDKPLLEAFVVSRCPFGLQMQRIMAEIVSKLPQSKDYLNVRYIGSITNGTITSMHGDEEAQENLRQICIREEQPDKYWDYVKCYMKEGNSAECLNSSAVDESKLDGCINSTGRGLVYAQEDFDLANKFNITGSPTLTMNDKIVSEFDFATNNTNGRSPEALKELLCCGFNTQPSFCSTQLNKTQAITMFTVRPKTAATTAAQQARGRDIPLARLGLKNPAQAMLITDDTMNSAVSQYPLLVVAASTTWCEWCKVMNVTIDDLSKELQGQVAFGLIEMDRNNDTKATYNITAYPTMLIFKDGKLASKVVGNQQKSSFVAKLKQVEPKLNTSNVKVVQAAPIPARPALLS
jgi:thioredoxin 1